MNNENQLINANIQTTPKQKIMIFIGACIIAFSNSVGFGAVNIALPSLLSGLNGMNLFSIFVMLTPLCASLIGILGGKLGDVFGRKKIYLISYVIVIASTIGCYFAFSANMLLGLFIVLTIASNVLGGGAAVTMVIDITDSKERAKFIGFVSVAGPVGMIVGPVITGLITDFFEPKICFLIPIPFYIVAMIILQAFYVNKPVSTKAPFDGLGLVLLAGFMLPLMFALNFGGSKFPWNSSTTFILLGIAIVAFVLFVIVEKRAKSPVVNFSFFTNKSFATACLVMGLIQGYISIVNMYLVNYAQTALDMSATVTGTFNIPKTICGVLLPAMVGVWLAKKDGNIRKGVIIVGSATAISMILGATFGADTGLPLIYTSMIFAGITAGVTPTTASTLVQKSFSPENIGAGMGVFQCVFAFFGGTYSAVFGGIFNGMFNINKIAPQALKAALDKETLISLSNQQVIRDPNALAPIRDRLPEDLKPVLDQTIAEMKNAVIDSIHIMYVVMAVAAVIVLCIGLFAMNEYKKGKVKEPSQTEAA